MSLKADPKYPSRRAYVVKFRGDAMPHALAGRIENLVTGRQLEFNSGGDLLDCIARDLREHDDELPADLTGVER
ncbi:MAG TPA: hypothetical protein VFI92_13770 [Steroidobacteraceae bacterium]|nr:hypothetical protein [Steroidobacteraceae bacterium]